MHKSRIAENAFSPASESSEASASFDRPPPVPGPRGSGRRALRVLMIAYTNYVYDGRLKRHSEALADRGDHVDIISLTDSAPSGDSKGVNLFGIEMLRYRGQSRWRYLNNYIRFFGTAAIRATQLSRKSPYDVVVVCTMPDAAVLSALGARLRGAKILLDVHDTMPELYQEKFGGRLGTIGARVLMLEERASAMLAHRVLAVHEPHRARLIQAGIPADKITVVMNPADTRIFTRRIEAQNNSRGEFNLFCHGVVTYRLGLDVAICAMDILRDRLPEARLRIIGIGDYFETVKEMIRARGLEDRVSISGLVPLEGLPSALATAGAGLVPNRANSATHLMLPVKLLEYATMGIPVIAARLRTIEYYFSGDSVCFFDPGDASSLASAIERVCRSPELSAQLSANAGKVAEHLSWHEQRKHFLDSIDALL
jgi:glycosyltransferase involved in cell wall biosynthesis